MTNVQIAGVPPESNAIGENKIIVPAGMSEPRKRIVAGIKIQSAVCREQTLRLDGDVLGREAGDCDRESQDSVVRSFISFSDGQGRRR